MKSKYTQDLIKVRESRPPVPRPAFVKQDPLSKAVRKYDNKTKLKPSFGEMVYIGTNEDGVAETVQQLAQFPTVQRGCHFGFSGWYNFDIAAARKSSRIIISDINPENALFLHETLTILRSNATPKEFIDAMKKYVTNHEFSFDGERVLNANYARSIMFSINVNSAYERLPSLEEELQMELTRHLSWVQDPEKFAHIRQLALTDKIALITEDICATETFIKIRGLLDDNAIQIDTLYLSNICDFMSSERAKEDYTNTVLKLAADAIIICAPNLHQTTFKLVNLDANELQKHSFLSDVAIETVESKESEAHQSPRFETQKAQDIAAPLSQLAERRPNETMVSTSPATARNSFFTKATVLGTVGALAAGIVYSLS